MQATVVDAKDGRPAQCPGQWLFSVYKTHFNIMPLFMDTVLLDQNGAFPLNLFLNI